MPFIILLFLTALLLEGMGTYISIIGLSQLFAGSAIILLLMGTLDLAKIVTVSFVYRYWKKVNFFLKTYMLIAVLVTMTITSAGAFSYLSRQFQEAYVGTQENTLQIEIMSEEQTRLQKRKIEIDEQISKLPPDWITAKSKMLAQFGPEIKQINERLAVIDKELPTLQTETLHKKVEVGPILFIAEAFKTSPEEAIKWIILTIILVFDPLAIALLVAGNFLVTLRQEKKEAERLAKEEKEKPYVPHDNSDLQELLKAATKKEDAVTKEYVDKSFAASTKPIVTFNNEGTLTASAEIYDGPNHLEFENTPPVKSVEVSAEELKKILNPKSEHAEGYLDKEPDLNLDEDLGRAGAFDGALDEVDHLTEEDLDAEFGRNFAFDNPLDEVDHLTDEELHANQGRAMAADDDEPDVPTARPVITMDDLHKSVNSLPRSSLEDVSDNIDVTFAEAIRVPFKHNPLVKAYDDENSPPTIAGR